MRAARNLGLTKLPYPFVFSKDSYLILSSTNSFGLFPFQIIGREYIKVCLIKTFTTQHKMQLCH